MLQENSHLVYFRKATYPDYEAICQLITNEYEFDLVYPSGTYPLTVEQIQYLSETRQELIVATDDVKIVGFANLYNLKENESVFIGNVVIDKLLRGQGIGKKLVSYMLDLGFYKYGLK